MTITGRRAASTRARSTRATPGRMTTPLSFMNMPILTYIKEISPRPVLLIHGEKAHSRYFSETAYAAAAEPKELMIIPGASPHRSVRPDGRDSVRQAQVVLQPAPNRIAESPASRDIEMQEAANANILFGNFRHCASLESAHSQTADHAGQAALKRDCASPEQHIET